MSSVSENVLPVGTRLADYEIVDVLGEGGFGIVYLAFDHSLHRNVAIKEYMPSALALRGGDAGVSLRAERHQDTFRLGLKSFINEARFLAQFDHPALVKVHRYWEQNRTAYTAMQYYDGRTIKDVVHHSPELIDEAWCLRVLANILQALDMLYAMQIVHRDVSPDNIIVQASGEAVLLDFGSARQVIGDMTRGLTVILKPGYAPVEQYAGDASLEQGAYTDIYALAAVMYFAITGKPPASSIARMIQDPLVPLATLAPAGFSPAFLAAIDKGLAVLAQDRPQTIEAFRAMLGIAPVAASAPRAAGAPPRTPLASATLAAADDEVAPAPLKPVLPSPVTVRMPVIDGATAPVPAAGAAGAAGAAAGTASAAAGQARPRRNWPSLIVALVAVVAAVWGLASLLRDGAEDTVMLAQQQPRSAPAPLPVPLPAAASASASVSASASTSASAAPPVAAAAAAAASANDPGTVPASAALDPQDTVLAPPPPSREPAAAVTAAVKSTPDTATVNFAIKPWGTVFVDGRERGVSPPLKRLTLPAGHHQIRVLNPGFAEYRTSIEIVKGKGAAVDHDFAHPR